MRGERLIKANLIARKRFTKLHNLNLAKADRDWWYGKHPEDLARHIGVLRKVTAICSNPICCGNPRRMGELTIQERKFKEKAREDIDYCGNDNVHWLRSTNIAD